MLALYIVVGIVLLVVLVLSIPVDTAFDVDGPGGARSRTRIGWLFGLLWKDVGRKRKKAPKKKKKERKGFAFLSLLMTRGVATGLLKLVRRIFSRIKVRDLDARLRIGLDDPADTGMLYSALWPALIPLTYTGSTRVRMELSFEEPALELAARGRIRVFPIRMVWPMLAFALSPAGLRMMKRMVVRR